jgi:hypothetical protein
MAPGQAPSHKVGGNELFRRSCDERRQDDCRSSPAPRSGPRWSGGSGGLDLSTAQEHIDLVAADVRSDMLGAQD